MSDVHFDTLIGQLEEIIASAHAFEERFSAELDQVHPRYTESARNLLHYVALRQFDIGELQVQLPSLGLSSLENTEHNVLGSLEAVLHALRRLAGGESGSHNPDERVFDVADRRMESHIDDLLGPRRRGRSVSIMVTLPADAATDIELVRSLLRTGMDIARINCAHGTDAEWQAMADNVRKACTELEQRCKIVFDIAGPKLRTGRLEDGPRVLALRPRRDATGKVMSARRILCLDESVPWTGKKKAVLPLPAGCIERAEIGDTIELKDSRGRRRRMKVVDKSEHGFVAELYKTAYIETGARIRLKKIVSGEQFRFRVGELPPVEQPILLRVGDTLIMHRRHERGAPAKIDKNDRIIEAAKVPVAPPEIIDQVSVGDPVRINDGKITGRVESKRDEEIVVCITDAKPAGSRLRSEKGVNFPASGLTLSALTEHDRSHLDFIVANADAIGLSFMHSPADVLELQAELDSRGCDDLGIILKIETVKAYNDLPRILLAAMRRYPAGVMIARGDLAVECGWVELAQIQEQILWMCEAAQVPVIWATQVLEGKAKKGMPTRAEITDAAVSQRADCVMLNKGPHILAAISMLDDILRSMQDHQHKKTSRLRKLKFTEM